VPLDSAQNPFLWWLKHKGRFPTLAYLARANLNIHGNQIEIEKVFSIANILTNLCQCHLGAKNLDLLVLLIKN
jgi:hypothetical protein